MKAAFCKDCATRLTAASPGVGGRCRLCHERWVAEYTRPAAKARRALAFAALVEYAKSIGLVRRSYRDEIGEIR